MATSLAYKVVWEVKCDNICWKQSFVWYVVIELNRGYTTKYDIHLEYFSLYPPTFLNRLRGDEDLNISPVTLRLTMMVYDDVYILIYNSTIWFYDYCIQFHLLKLGIAETCDIEHEKWCLCLVLVHMNWLWKDNLRLIIIWLNKRLMFGSSNYQLAVIIFIDYSISYMFDNLN